MLLKTKDKNIIYNMTLKIILLIKIIKFLLRELREQKYTENNNKKLCGKSKNYYIKNLK